MKPGREIRCPECRYWLMRANFEGTVEVTCGNGRCQVPIEVEIKAGLPTLRVLGTSKQ